MDINGSNSTSKSGMVIRNQRKENEGIRFGNPFTLKVGQVFTGFGIGCGIGIGVGRPLNLGKLFKFKNGEAHLSPEAKKPCAIPVLSEVMSAARGATSAFSGVTRHVNDTFKKLGAKNIEAGIGCGVGIGHGFGVGLALKPSALHQIQFCIAQAMTKMMMKFGMAPNLPIGLGALPSSLQGGMSMVNNYSTQNPMGSMMQLATKLPDQSFQGLPGYENKSTGASYGNIMSKTTSVDAPFGTRTEKVLSSFLQNPILKGEGRDLNEVDGRLRTENDILHMVLKHQQVIEELQEENERLRQILVEELKVSPGKLQTSYSIKNRSPCSDCFDCRRKQRKR